MQSSSELGNVPPHYKTLGVDPSITPEDLTKHYRKVSLQLHPDRVAHREGITAEERRAMDSQYQRITEAYRELSDAEKRSAYDTRHGVNFNARVHSVLRTIHSHNDAAQSRMCATKTAEETSRTTAEKRRRDETEKEAPAEEEEEEEYNPDSFSEDEVAASREKDTKFFSLQLLGVMDRTSHLRSIRLVKRRTRDAEGAIIDTEKSWGIVLHQNYIVDCDKTKYDGDNRIIFPCRIVQIGHFSLGDEEQPVTDKLRQVEEEARRRAPDKDVEVSILVKYNVQDWLLVGDATLLQNADVLDKFVAEGSYPLLSQLRSSVITAVNGNAVENGAELKEALAASSQANKTVLTAAFLPQIVKKKSHNY
ncbi:DnaJ domain containing protein, putative [Angomonas deanei]|uniref:DnaJ domain containing protein, putative n=1 Tax=Angomonas deanei TaxID=59799 RepID=A0A7G2CL09_9TRYP|nr:DnaJ domain containing protein, putative [Angomonas deanei]